MTLLGFWEIDGKGYERTRRGDAYPITILVAVLMTPVSLTLAMPAYACSNNDSDVKVFLVVPDGNQWGLNDPTGRDHLSVVIQNHSQQTLRFYDEWNSWGHFNVHLVWRDAEGHSGTVTAPKVSWTKNYASSKTLLPGEIIVREVTRYWEGWPAPRNGMPVIMLTMKAIYEIPTESEPHFTLPDGADVPPNPVPLWCGSAESKELTAQFYAGSD